MYFIIRVVFIVSILVLLILALALHAPTQVLTDKEKEFVFARLKYIGQNDIGNKGWFTDYPSMDEHTCDMLERLTYVRCKHETVGAESSDIFRYPFIYCVEPEQVIISDKEVKNLQEWFMRGGFLMLDDFHGDEDLLPTQMWIKRVLPKVQWVELSLEHQLFHTVFDVNKIEQVLNDAIALCPDMCVKYENGPTGMDPKVYMLVDDVGERGVAFFNTDLGDGLEWIDFPEYDHKMSVYATKVITNTVVYALTH